MTKDEKKRVARKLLEDHGYPEDEIVKMLRYAFDGKRVADSEKWDWAKIDDNRT